MVRSVDVGSTVAVEFRAVAEVSAFVYESNGKCGLEGAFGPYRFAAYIYVVLARRTCLPTE